MEAVTDPTGYYPVDEDAERQVVGSILVSAGKSLDDMDIDLKSDRFHKPAHQLIIEAALDARGQNKPCDPVTLAAVLRERGDLRAAGGAPYLHTLYGECMNAWSMGYHYESVTDAWMRRVILEEGIRMQTLAHDGALPPAQLVDRARSALDDVSERLHGSGEAKMIGDGLDEVIANLGSPDMFTSTTGWFELDRIIGGWRPGSVTIVAARPGSGKTLFGITTALHVAKTAPVLFHSLEMGIEELQKRALSAGARVNLARFTSDRKMTDDEWARVHRASGHLDSTKLVIDPRIDVTAADIMASARTWQRRMGGLGLVVVDYVGLVNAPERRGENRERALAKVSRSMKVMAKTLNVPVLVLSQLNRKSEDRADGKPKVSDLRESGSMEQDADAVILLHRDAAREDGELEVHVGKNRHGMQAGCNLAWQAHHGHIGNLGEAFQ